MGGAVAARRGRLLRHPNSSVRSSTRSSSILFHVIECWPVRASKRASSSLLRSWPASTLQKVRSE
eukprot:scaffold130390_cov31-Tisochrysis_lutea.AAC.3